MFLILVWFGLLLFFFCWVLFMYDLRNLCLSQGPGGRPLCYIGRFLFYHSHLDRRSVWSWLAGGRREARVLLVENLEVPGSSQLAPCFPHGTVAVPLSSATCAGVRPSGSPRSSAAPCPSLWASPRSWHRAAEVPQLCCSSGCLSCCWPLHL